MANRDRSEHDAQIDELMHAAAARNVSRRDLLKRATALGAGASVLAGLNAVGASAAPSLNRLRMMNAALQGEALADEQVVRLPEGEPVRFDPGVSCGG